MSDFLPLESSPYWTSPKRTAPDDKTEHGASERHAGNQHGGRHLNESLAHLLHAFHIHYYGEPAEKDVHPRADLVESKDAFTAYVELPGMTRDDVHVEVNDHLFTVGFSGQLRRQRSHEASNGDVTVEHKDPAANTEDAGLPESAGKETETPGKELRWHISERKTGHFHRVLQLPIRFVDMSGTKASMADGLLTVTVPKRPLGAAETEKGRKVDISTENNGTAPRTEATAPTGA